jgi:hypothetical protein
MRTLRVNVPVHKLQLIIAQLAKSSVGFLSRLVELAKRAMRFLSRLIEDLTNPPSKYGIRSITQTGEYVRSKAEQTIADYLTKRNLDQLALLP